MTRPRFDNKSTEFGLWLRQQEELESSLGYIASNLDYIWCNYRTKKWMLIEEKRYRAEIKLYQNQLFERIDKLCRPDSYYKGFHRIVFENTSPEDGQIWLDGHLVTKKELLRFLCFSS